MTVRFQPHSTAPQTMYRIGGGKNVVELVKVIKITPKTITILGSFFGGPLRPERHNLHGYGREYFKTFEEAKAALVARRKSNLEGAYAHIQSATKALAEAEMVVDPASSLDK